MCDIYETCGGCQIMHLKYDKQLEFKTDLLQQALKKFSPEGFEQYDIRPTIGMQEPLYYRAKLHSKQGNSRARWRQDSMLKIHII